MVEIVADPEIFVNPVCAECAVTVPDPGPDGVNPPPEVTIPPVAVQVTAELNAPVPCTLARHVLVCVVRIDDGEHVAETEVIVGGGTITVITAAPDLVASCKEVALQLAVPAAAGVNTPADVMVPLVADQLTAELKAPVPSTVAVQVEV